MRLCVFPIFRIPAGELPINNCSNLVIAYDDIPWAKICMGEVSAALASMSLHDRFTKNFCTILQGNLSTEKRMKVIDVTKGAKRTIAHPSVIDSS